MTSRLKASTCLRSSYTLDEMMKHKESQSINITISNKERGLKQVKNQMG